MNFDLYFKVRELNLLMCSLPKQQNRLNLLLIKNLLL